jgi:DNA mismatch repair ATPase MutS
MQIDGTSYTDLSIFHSEDEFSVFHKLDFTRTAAGKECLLRHFREPFSRLQDIRDTQSVINIISAKLSEWPVNITNGTLLVIEKFLDYNLDGFPDPAGPVNSQLYRLLHGPDFSITRFSLTHLSDLTIGMRKILRLLDEPGMPDKLGSLLARAGSMLGDPVLEELEKRPDRKSFTVQETIRYGRFFHEVFRQQAFALMQIYAQLDAWYSMAIAMQTHRLVFPDMSEEPDPFIEAKGLFHILLTHPVPYDVMMDPRSNFIFLTGANMAGKSTFIKSVGLAVFLAHLGMGVPATHMRLTLFDGILSNINVVDNIVRGESYFFNEVQRIKHTVERINDNRRWLVLIDELFKGTNIQDAMKCSTTVIRGLIRINRALFILSTHLYEIGEELRTFPNISFRYFETNITDEQLSFTYQLKEGISNDRLGYLILKREKVVEMLERL